MLVLIGLVLRSEHTMRQVAATCCGDRSLLVYRSSNKLQQLVGTTCRSDKLLHVYWRIFVKLFVSATSRKNQIRLNLCNLLQQQNFVAATTMILPRILQYTQSNLSLWHVAATCRLVYCVSGPLIIRQASMNIYFSLTTEQHFFK